MTANFCWNAPDKHGFLPTRTNSLYHTCMEGTLKARPTCSMHNPTGSECISTISLEGETARERKVSWTWSCSYYCCSCITETCASFRRKSGTTLPCDCTGSTCSALKCGTMRATNVQRKDLQQAETHMDAFSWTMRKSSILSKLQTEATDTATQKKVSLLLTRIYVCVRSFLFSVLEQSYVGHACFGPNVLTCSTGNNRMQSPHASWIRRLFQKTTVRSAPLDNFFCIWRKHCECLCWINTFGDRVSNYCSTLQQCADQEQQNSWALRKLLSTETGVEETPLNGDQDNKSIDRLIFTTHSPRKHYAKKEQVCRSVCLPSFHIYPPLRPRFKLSCSWPLNILTKK